MAHEIHQIGGILAVVDGEGRREPDRLGVFAQEPRADGVERAGPAHGVGRRGAVRRHEGGDDPLDPPRHLRRRAARERQQHDAARIGPLRDQPRHPMRQGRRLARAGAGDDEQRPRLRERQPAMLGGAALLRIELVEQRRGHGLRITSGIGSGLNHDSRFVRNEEACHRYPAAMGCISIAPLGLAAAAPPPASLDLVRRVPARGER